jgi:hypothetical protein
MAVPRTRVSRVLSHISYWNLPDGWWSVSVSKEEGTHWISGPASCILACQSIISPVVHLQSRIQNRRTSEAAVEAKCLLDVSARTSSTYITARTLTECNDLVEIRDLVKGAAAKLWRLCFLRSR